ncbi:MAG TPA: CmcI family methyltransferase [Bryobacteraceae bacterium]|nr:CmcI family methyltransferase [Bryobacteraceae bacterium]
MRIVIDTAARTLTTAEAGAEQTHGLYTPGAFDVLTREWTRVGWSLRYYANFAWFGLPVLQMPEDLMRVQEVIYRLRPDVIIETGVWRGGSLTFYASLCEALGNGRVIGIDKFIRPEDERAIAAHRLSARIRVIEGDSTSPDVVQRVREGIGPGESVLIVLDSAHDKDHVDRELECWCPLVTPGSYIVVADGVMRDLADVPGGEPQWIHDNPYAAAVEFAARHPEFVHEEPRWLTDEPGLPRAATYWPAGWLRRVR